MSESNLDAMPLAEFSLWDRIRGKRIPLSFELEVTARCNNDCRHCYINLPPGDRVARDAELSLGEIGRIADEAVGLGALWCLITGGEPLLRRDFQEIYTRLKKAGLLVSLFTNATLLKTDHVELFKRYPPRDIEVTVYGATRQTYERVTRTPGSFSAFRKGLDLLAESGIPFHLKAIAIRSNAQELNQITRFCREKSSKPFRFDPMLHLRYDGDAARNHEIEQERLGPNAIVELERADQERLQALQKTCEETGGSGVIQGVSQLLVCGAGKRSFVVGFDGQLRLCSSLWHPEFVYDLRRGSVTHAWEEFIPRVRKRRAEGDGTVVRCAACSLNDLCIWCPAHAYLETGAMEKPVPYFCEVAHARAQLREKD